MNNQLILDNSCMFNWIVSKLIQYHFIAKRYRSINHNITTSLISVASTGIIRQNEDHIETDRADRVRPC